VPAVTPPHFPLAPLLPGNNGVTSRQEDDVVVVADAYVDDDDVSSVSCVRNFSIT